MDAFNLGTQLRRWRRLRGLSQLELSLRSGISTRHLSVVESGRARAGRELVLRVADELDIPLRDRNVLLVAAGFAPVFREGGYAAASLAPVRNAIAAMLEIHRPFPAYVLDRRWNVVVANGALPQLYEGVADELRRAPVNGVRLMLHPRGLAPRILNLGVWRSHYLAQLRRQRDLDDDAEIDALLREVASYPGDDSTSSLAGMEAPALPLRVRTSLGELSFLSATTVFGGPLDVTVQEIALQTLYPADAATDSAVRAAAALVHQQPEFVSP